MAVQARRSRSLVVAVIVLVAAGCGVSPPAGSSTSPVIAVDGGDYHACAVRADGTVWCWGDNSQAQLGNGTTVSSTAAVQVGGVSDAIAVTATMTYSCALLEDATVTCWGTLLDQIGVPNPQPVLAAVPVTGLSDVTSIDAGATQICAVRSDRSGLCWGHDGVEHPTAVWNDVTAITAGVAHACAIVTGGHVECSGIDSSGELGDGSVNDAVAISGGYFYTCAVRADGSVSCWGYNHALQLGTEGKSRSTPQTVAGLDGALSVSTAEFHTCALRADGHVGCWGRNTFGERGDGTLGGFTAAPSTVVDIDDAGAMTTTVASSCALRDGGSVWCWGLLLGSAATNQTPQRVAGL